MPAHNGIQGLFERFSRLARRSTPGIWQVIGERGQDSVKVASQVEAVLGANSFRYEEGARGLAINFDASVYDVPEGATDNSRDWAYNDARFVAWCGAHKKTLRRALYLYAMLSEPTNEQRVRLMQLFPIGTTTMTFVSLMMAVNNAADAHGRQNNVPDNVVTGEVAERHSEESPRGTEHEEFDEDGATEVDAAQHDVAAAGESESLGEVEPH